MKVPTDQAYLMRTSAGPRQTISCILLAWENVPESQKVPQHFIYFIEVHCGLVFGTVRVGRQKGTRDLQVNMYIY